MKKDMLNKIYELYKLDWMRTHNPDVVNEYKIWAEFGEDSTFEEWVEENGYGGELYVCFDEFMETEMQDREYILNLVDGCDYLRCGAEQYYKNQDSGWKNHGDVNFMEYGGCLVKRDPDLTMTNNYLVFELIPPAITCSEGVYYAKLYNIEVNDEMKEKLAQSIGKIPEDDADIAVELVENGIADLYVTNTTLYPSTIEDARCTREEVIDFMYNINITDYSEQEKSYGLKSYELSIRAELEVSSKTPRKAVIGHINTWFDTNDVFGLDLDEDIWVQMKASYSPFDRSISIGLYADNGFDLTPELYIYLEPGESDYETILKLLEKEAEKEGITLADIYRREAYAA